MAGPEHGFPHHTFFINEESNDLIPFLRGAVPCRSFVPAERRQAGYTAYLDTVTGINPTWPVNGRHNHENQVVDPGAWAKASLLSGDDTFTSTSNPSAAEP